MKLSEQDVSVFAAYLRGEEKSPATVEKYRREGEGDCSLAFWRQVHEAFFTEELARAGMAFRQDLPVVCEEFVKVYSQPT